MSSVHVHVSLSPQLGDQYRKTFKTWLEQSVQKEFGVLAGVTVTDFIVQASPRSINENSTPLGFELDGESTFLFASLVVIAISLVVFTRRRQVEVSAFEPAAEAVAPLATASPDTELNNYQRKVSLILAANNENIKAIADKWLAEGIEGKRKLAAVLDCAFKEKLEFTGSDEATTEIQIPEMIQNDKSLIAAARSFGVLISTEEKLELLARAFGDIIAFQPNTSIESQPSPVATAALAAPTKTQASEPKTESPGIDLEDVFLDFADHPRVGRS